MSFSTCARLYFSCLLQLITFLLTPVVLAKFVRRKRTISCEFQSSFS